MDNLFNTQEANETFPDNPKAASLALGLALLQQSAEESFRINESLVSFHKKKIDELEKELAFWKPLAQKWIKLKNLLLEEKPNE